MTKFTECIAERDRLSAEIGTLRERVRELEDAAMWTVKNFDEWSDTDAWAGPELDHLSTQIEALRALLNAQEPAQGA